MLASPFEAERRFVLLTCLALALLELLGCSGVAAAPHDELLRAFASPLAALDVLGPRLAFITVVYLLAGSRLRAAAILTVASLALTGLLYGSLGADRLPAASVAPLFFAISAAAAIAHLSLRYRRGDEAEQHLIGKIGWGLCLSILFSFLAAPSLGLTATLSPATHDQDLFRLEAVPGGSLSAQVALLVHWLHGDAPILFAYQALPLALIALFGLQVRFKPAPRVSILEYMMLSLVAAWIAYNVYPVAGPAFAFEGFPGALPDPATLPPATLILGNVPRNGVPSMHFGWALVIWLISLRDTPRAAQRFFLLFLALTATATLATGQHYLVDLVISLPFNLALYALCHRDAQQEPARRHALRLGIGLYVAWLFALGYGIEWLIAHRVAFWSACALTVGLCVPAYRGLQALGDATPAARGTREAAKGFLNPAVPAMFFASGAAALIYQVLFSKQLAYVFGSMSTATSTVLATYMGGLAMGSYLGGRLATGLRRPLLAYAWCECAIGLYCLLTPWIFRAIQAAYVMLAEGSAPEAHGLIALRVLLGASALLPPTLLMGMTLPVLARHFEQRQVTLGISVGRLYAFNTAGAALGALLAGYALIPLLGMQRTGLLAVILNLAVGYAAFRMQSAQRAAAGDAPALAAAGAMQTGDRPGERRLALMLLTVGGFVTLALEVVDVHLLAVAAGNSAYAFSLMLFAFLAGLSGGAQWGQKLLQRHAVVPLLVTLECALALAVGFGLIQTLSLPDRFSLYAYFPVTLGFAAREVIRGLACCIAMAPAAFMIGAIYPVAIECACRAAPAPLRMLGRATALNTLGNIAGALIAGFALIPLLGGFLSAWLLIALCLLLALMAVMSLPKPQQRNPAAVVLAAILACLVFVPTRMDYTPLTIGANVYFGPQDRGTAIDHAESLDGGLTTVNLQRQANGAPPLLTLLTNGKFQGNNSVGGEMLAQSAFAVAPLLHLPARGSALVLGYGTGNTSRVLHDAGFRRLDISDLSADVLNLADRYLENINHGVRGRPGVSTHVTDGRNYLLLTPQRYDLISMEVSSIWFAGAAALYSRDFYRLAKTRLEPDGVLQQWMQLHHAYPSDLLHILASIRAEFRYLWVYYVGGQGIIVASDSPRAAPAPEYAQLLDHTSALGDILALYGGSSSAVAQRLLLTPEGVDRLLQDTGCTQQRCLSTDDNAYLEYSTPKGNALDSAASTQANLSLLSRYSALR